MSCLLYLLGLFMPRSRSRSRSGPRGNRNPSGDAAETAAEAALVSAAVAVGGVDFRRGDPLQGNPRLTFVDFNVRLPGSYHYMTIQHKGCEGGGRKTSFKAGGKAQCFRNIKVDFIMFTISSIHGIDYYLMKPNHRLIKNRRTIQWNFQEFRNAFAAFHYSAEELMQKFKEELGG